MCGIAGIVHADPHVPVDPALLTRMGDAIRHRGPDDAGLWTGPGIGLAHRRLSIIDLSPAGHQPMSNEDGTVWIVFNGEIYNFLELREDLLRKGHRFRSRTDTEVIVHLYEEEGDACVERLEGMFAIALWDEPRRRLLLARDRVGKKPLKFAEIAGGLVFASELKAILATGLVPREVADEDLHHFLSFGNVPAPGTGFRAIRKLLPGHSMVFESGRVRCERYWSLDYRRKRRLAFPDWCAEVRATVRRAVERRLISDVPLGAFLSGGIDSSVVVACMAEASSRPVETFSIGFEHERWNELPHARRVAERYATSHHEFVVRADGVDLLPSLARLYEEPYADSSALPSWFLARETRRHVTVALNGDGGDEAFGGYVRYRQMARLRPLLTALRPPFVREALERLAARPGLSPGWARRLELGAALASPDVGVAYSSLVRLLSDRDKAALWRTHAAREPSHRLLARWLEDPRAGTALLDRLTFADVMAYLPDDLLPKMDLATMAHSLEARSPLLDHHVLELAASAPPTVRVRGGRLKHLLKSAFRDAIPAEILDRPKAGFAIPIQEWFRGPWAPFARECLLARDARLHTWFRRQALEGLIGDHVAGRADRGYPLFALVMLELWCREVVEAPPG
jgi:asparagine synthase (glutamine-hydrolysing)